MKYCPVCRSKLPAEQPAECPECSADLEPFYEVAEKSRSQLETARTELRSGNASRARELSRDARKLWSKSEQEARRIELESLLVDRRLDQARELLQKSQLDEDTERDIRLRLRKLEQDERSAKERYNAGVRAARKGFYRDAERELEHALDIAPHLVKPYIALTKVHLALDEPEQALEVIDRAHRQAPVDSRVDTLRMRVARELDPESEAAGKDWESRFFPDGVWAWLASNMVEILVLILLIWLAFRLGSL